MNYHPTWSSDGKWIIFTSERRGWGQSDLYRVRSDGSGEVETLVDTDSVEDSGTLSPCGSKVAYVSTYGNYTTNIWVKDLVNGTAFNLTDTAATRSSDIWPSGHYRPQWSPDGEWIAFSSDRNTDWTGHSDGVGWEHTQSLGLYIIRPNGSDFRAVIPDRNLSLSFATPKWSKDSLRLTYSNMTTEDTYGAHGVSTQQEAVNSSIYSVDIATGTDIKLESYGVLRVSSDYIGNSSNIGFVVKAGDDEGIAYTIPDSTHKAFNRTSIRSPSWSPDGTKLVYEIASFDQQPADLKLWSFDPEWDYRYMDVFPTHNVATNRMATTQKVEGYANGSAITSTPLYEDLVTALDSYSIYSLNNTVEVEFLEEGESGAFQPSFNEDGSEILVGFGAWFVERVDYPAAIWRATVNGTSQYNLTDTDGDNYGFPAWSPDGTAYAYRVWSTTNGAPLGIRIFNFTTNATTQLTTGWDNTPGWSPDGELIVFTRNNNWTWSYGDRWYQDRFDVYTIKPDGTDLHRVTDSLANDAHAVWTADGRIAWSSGMYGFKDESCLQDNTFQPYGQIMIMNADGTDKKVLVDTIWEDSMPLYMPKEYLPSNYTL